MKTIGLTGGIGSGKSTVARIFRHMGYPVYIADTEASRLMHISPEIRHEITARFGPSVYREGILDKAALAKVIFEDKEALQSINRIVHPRVMEDFRQWCEEQSRGVAFFESAILYEAGLSGFFHHTVCVTAPEEVRIQRVIARDRTSREKVLERIHNQMEENEKVRLSDFHITNDGRTALLPQVVNIIQQVTTKSN